MLRPALKESRPINVLNINKAGFFAFLAPSKARSISLMFVASFNVST